MARAMDNRCFSPPETLIPPSPIVEFNPSSARCNNLLQLALCNTSSNSSSVADGFTNNKFSRIVPENNCASCVTNPSCFLKSNKSISVESIELYFT